ncbi:MAG: lipoprotein-releasing system ATP-binding protein [Candidatus Sumerlaeota bacterium]|nr:lipoprotein-releasing system ATP-binding protein [Candidatus Sumerlaeota bacterium]
MAEVSFLKIDRVSKRYGRSGTRFVFSGLSAAIGSREIAVLSGPSGSGKTTLLNLIGGLDRLDEGSIRCAGTEVSALSEKRRAVWRARNMGYIFQHHLLPRGLTALETVLGPLLWAAGENPARARAAAVDALASVGLGDHAKMRVERLSGGQRQRVAIARAVALQPRLLLADEPTAHLDRRTAGEIAGVLVAQARERGATLIVVSHEAGHQGWTPDRRFVLDEGTLAEC